MLARRGKITGSRLKDIIVKRGPGPKLAFYEVIAERLSIPGEYENPMARGKRLESEAIEKFEEETGFKVNPELALWCLETNESIAVSPDGVINETEAVEVKCLASGRHIQAFIEQKIPDEYWEQVLQYFIVNPKLQNLYFVFYDPRLLFKSFFYISVKRSDIEEEIQWHYDYQIKTLGEIDEWVNKLSL